MPFKNAETQKAYMKVYSEKWNREHKEGRKIYDRERNQNNKEENNIRTTQYRKNNPKYRIHVKTYLKAYYKKYYVDNKERVVAGITQYRKNSLKYKAHRREKYRTDLKYNLNSKIRRTMNACLRGNKSGWRWEDLVGYTVVDLIERLRETIPKGCNWNDFLQGKLQIDYAIPINAFNFTEPRHFDFQRCWSLENLRLLSARENNIKNNNLDKPFQPALRMG